MDSVFEQLDVVGSFARLRWPDGVRPLHLLWPVWCRRVSTPSCSDERVGPFERAVLNCARAGVTDTQHVADLLSLDRKFIELIQRTLRSGRQLTEDLRITDEGQSTLESGLINTLEIRTLYTFTCAFSGELLPRTSEQLFLADARWEGDTMVIHHDSDGGGRSTPCFRLKPPVAHQPPIPDALDVLAAARRHVEDLAAARGRRSREGIEDGDPSAVAPSVLHRVGILDRQAQPMFLATIVYTDPSRPSGEDGFIVEDPFGLGPSRRLRDRLRRIRSDDPKVAERLARSLRANLEETDLVNDYRLYWQVCEEDCRRRLAPAVVPVELLEPLTAVDYSLYRYGERGIPPGERDLHLKNAARDARGAIEIAFGKLAERYPFSAIKAHVDELRDGNRDDAAEVAWQVRNAVRILGLDPRVPERFAKVKVSALRNVVLNAVVRRYQLTALIAATLIVATRHHDHPLFQMAKVRPDFVDDLARAITVGGGASHGERVESRDVVEHLRDVANDCTRIAIGAILRPVNQMRTEAVS